MRSFCFALQHLTRIRLYTGAFDESTFGRSAAFFPAVGLLLGLLVLAAGLLFKYLFPLPVVAALLVVTLVFLTGGIHLDGFMDTMDGIFSGRNRERKLEIMRDSRVGAFGVLGLACLLLLKYTAFLTMPPELMTQSILLAMTLSRWSMAYAIAFFPYARREGLGTLFHRYTGKREALAASASTLVFAGLIAGGAGFLLLLAAWGWVHFVGCKMTRELGGLTGDIYGATGETTEVLICLLSLPLYAYAPVLFGNPGLLLK
ncbi:adenosylcobinamide-GDP ribazoletransferase [Desulfallas sp. Bu1-1]|uniref:adenosylcobinamide-GDP ribazoletransferase n=1 Tax=Desulfallas sp. Bu1-1 TaxID=2787620 RepID=UPI00189FF4BD|nr:adenosylcobinamide-GDP ribazoletransferase [Desulfallas sp. Bu1-1]MBF7083061.1 adenosylcobinamide-GDP ribazoletransferase [Desulfallas sp. Bu1-1]